MSQLLFLLKKIGQNNLGQNDSGFFAKRISNYGNWRQKQGLF